MRTKSVGMVVCPLYLILGGWLFVYCTCQEQQQQQQVEPERNKTDASRNRATTCHRQHGIHIQLDASESCPAERDVVCHQSENEIIMLEDDSSKEMITTTSSSSSSSSSTPANSNAPSQINSDCTIYLAPSTIPGAGLGIFTTIPRKQGETIGNGDIFLPLYDLALHNVPSTLDDNAKQQLRPRHTGDAYFNPFYDYVWTGETMGMAEEGETADDVEAMCPGLDAAINCHLGLINVGKATPMWDDGGLHRSRDPGAGAITPYHNGTTPIVYRDIPAGGELFKHYGDAWFETRSDLIGYIPLSDDYPRAQNLLHEFGRLAGIDPASPSSSSFHINVDIQRDLWSLMTNIPFSSRTLNALPRALEDAWRAIEANLESLIQPRAVRDVGFLEEYGKCFDHIRPGRSRFPQAGRGAFAVRPLSKGTIISGSPVLHLPKHNVFHIHEFRVDEETGQRQRSDYIIGKQITLNYCFGHPESMLLLCPYGAGVSYINHNQTLANVRVQWSQNGLTSHNDSWLNLDPLQMEWIYKPHLALDYIALRDIEEGEELFMDYGDAFEAAWQHHVLTWKPENNSATYTSAHDFNQGMTNTFLRTEKEQELDPYPQNLQVRCHSTMAYDWWKHTFPSTRTADVWSLEDKGFPCRIIHRVLENGVDMYDVVVHATFDEDTKVTEVQRYRVPRHAVAFCDKPHSTDIHLRNAFRFPMMMPDDMFPAAWRNAMPYKS